MSCSERFKHVFERVGYPPLVDGDTVKLLFALGYQAALLDMSTAHNSLHTGLQAFRPRFDCEGCGGSGRALAGVCRECEGSGKTT